MILKLKATEILKVCSVISIDLYRGRVERTIHQSIFTKLMDSFKERNNTELSKEEITALTKYLQEKINRKTVANENTLTELKTVLTIISEAVFCPICLFKTSNVIRNIDDFLTFQCGNPDCGYVFDMDERLTSVNCCICGESHKWNGKFEIDEGWAIAYDEENNVLSAICPTCEI